MGEGVLKYPVTDEEPDPPNGRRSAFQGGAIRWSPDTGATLQLMEARLGFPPDAEFVCSQCGTLPNACYVADFGHCICRPGYRFSGGNCEPCMAEVNRPIAPNTRPVTYSSIDQVQCNPLPDGVPLPNEPVLGIFQLIKCGYYVRRFGGVINECSNDIIEHCNDLGVPDPNCEAYIWEFYGAQNPSDAVFNCLAKRDPTAFSKLITACGKGSLGHILK